VATASETTATDSVATASETTATDSVATASETTATDRPERTDDGEATSAAVRARHVSTLRAAGSATVTLRLQRESDNGTLAFERTTAVDFDDERLRENGTITGSTLGGFVSTTLLEYEQFESVDERVVRGSTPLANGTVEHYDALTAANESWRGANASTVVFGATVGNSGTLSWTERGRTTFEGTTVTRYTATNPSNISGSHLNASVSLPAQSNESASNPTNVTLLTVHNGSASKYVGPDGAVRYLQYRVDATEGSTPVTYVATLRITDVGSTTVTEPAWTESVRANATGA
jgi:hypothetical protein